MKAVQFFNLRGGGHQEWWVNPEAVYSFYRDVWPGTETQTCIEVRGQQGYRNHNIYVKQSPQEVAQMFRDAHKEAE